MRGKRKNEERENRHTTIDDDINGKHTVRHSFYFYRARARRVIKLCVVCAVRVSEQSHQRQDTVLDLTIGWEYLKSN